MSCLEPLDLVWLNPYRLPNLDGGKASASDKVFDGASAHAESASGLRQGKQWCVKSVLHASNLSGAA